jgi:hypothetical protein
VPTGVVSAAMTSHDPTGRVSASVRRPSALRLVTVVLWIAVLVEWFFFNYLWTWLWVLVLILIWSTAMLSIAMTLAWSLRFVLRRRWIVGFVVLIPAVAVGSVTLRVPWEDAYSRAWFALHRDAFVHTEALVRSGAIDPAGDGTALPESLAGIAIDGQLNALFEYPRDDGAVSSCMGPVEFAAAVYGIPDGAVGFVHLPCDQPPPDYFLEAFGDGIIPRIELGDGWWWADGRTP